MFVGWKLPVWDFSAIGAFETSLEYMVEEEEKESSTPNRDVVLNYTAIGKTTDWSSASARFRAQNSVHLSIPTEDSKFQNFVD